MKTKILLLTSFIFILCSSQAQIIHVPGEYPTIQEGINASNDGDTVLVAENTYYENVKFMGKAITVASEFIIDANPDHINNTIIDGSQASNPDSASTVMFVNGEDTTSIIQGFTITGGGGTFNSTWGFKIGGGIFCWESGAKILNNLIVNNIVTNPSIKCGGAGIGSSMETGSYWVIIDNNDISNNLAAANSLSAFGGGIYVTTNAIIKNNSIQFNNCFNSGTQADGGGIEAQHVPGQLIDVTIKNNDIQNNGLESDRAEGAGIMIFGVRAQITNNNISNNYNNATSYSLGAGIMSREAIYPITISSNLISDNSGTLIDAVNVGSGICILEAFDVEFVIDGNTIKGNESNHGGAMYERSSHNILFTNNVVKENIAERGAGIGIFHPEIKSFLDNSYREIYYPQFINNVFIGNSSSIEGGALRFAGSINQLISFNNIFWQNSAPIGPDVHNISDEIIIIAYSDIDINDISGLWDGENNINQDPEFSDTLYHISLESPCFNSGIDQIEIDGVTYNCPNVDFDGDLRPLYGLADIGADEVYVIGIPDNIILESYTLNLKNFPNPFTSSTTIEFRVPSSGYTSLKLYDLFGKEVGTLLSKELLAGKNTIHWNASDIEPGIYYLKISFERQTETIKLLCIQ